MMTKQPIKILKTALLLRNPNASYQDLMGIWKKPEPDNALNLKKKPKKKRR